MAACSFVMFGYAARKTLTISRKRRVAAESLMAAFHPLRSLSQSIDRLRQLYVPLRHAARVMGGQPEIDLVLDIGELRMVVDLLRMHRHAGQET